MRFCILFLLSVLFFFLGHIYNMFSSASYLLHWMTSVVFNNMQKKIMIIICCVILGVVIASIIGGTVS